MTIDYHPHVPGINSSVEPIYHYKTKNEFLLGLKSMAVDQCYPEDFALSDITFHQCYVDEDSRDCSEDFLNFVKETGWRAIFAVCLERPGEHYPLGYSNRCFAG